MSTNLIVAIALAVVGLPLVLWAVGRTVTATAERAAHGLGRGANTWPGA